MSSLSYTVSDSATMLRRQLRHMLRYPSMTLILVGMPVVFLLLFVYVFGGTLGAGLGGPGPGGGGRAEYVNYVTPGIILITLAAVIGVALLIGFRPTTGLVEWVAATGVLVMVTVALVWLSVALGLVTESVETASNLPMPLVFLPFLGSGFVPTDSMPVGLRWFAEYQPFTPVIETVRGLLMGTPIGNSGYLAVAWCVGIALASYLWARRLFNRDPSHQPAS